MHSETPQLIRLCMALLLIGMPSDLVQQKHRLAIGFAGMQLDPWLSVLKADQRASGSGAVSGTAVELSFLTETCA